MTCSGCGFENPAGMKFCGECGAAIEARCSSCNTTNPPGFKFCGGCGGSLTANAGTPAPAPRDYTPRHLADKILQSKSALEGERKRVTILFADVKSSMELAAQIDPEEWHRILDSFFQILADGIHRFEGTVNQYTGDGVMALFGAPIAHEDHAQRACFAALHLRDKLKEYSDGLRLSQGLDFSVRMGINSGDVVVGRIGDDLRMDYTAQGHTVGLAQRMEQLAAAHSIYLAEETARLVDGYFKVRDLGDAQVKGVEEPLRVHELEGMGELQTRFDVSRARGLTRFVGRESDMQVLDHALEQAGRGNGQVIGVVAEAGTGKSRLCFEFVERCRAKGIRVNQGSGVPHGKNIPLLPFLQVFRSYYGITDEDDDRAAREKIAGRMLLIDEEFRESLPFVFDLLGVPDPERPAPSMEPEALQKVLFGVMRRLVESRSSEGPIVTLIEDLHWIDAGTETWLEQMVEMAATTRLLLLVNFRPEYRGSWTQKTYYRQLPLLPLDADAIQELLVDLLGIDSSIAGLGNAIHQRTAGNPFFTEEVVQALIESGNLEGGKGDYRLVTPIEQLTVPSTVQSVLAARIDRLDEREKQVLQTASVIGNEFPERILEAVAEVAASELGVSLQSLKDGEFIYQQSLYPISEYAFKHPLTQEVALGSQLQGRRKQVHAAVARALTEVHSEHLDELAPLLAHHYESAGEILEAVRWHRRAAVLLGGRDQIGLIAHWQKVHDLSSTLPATREAMEHSLMACDMLLSNGWRTGMTEEEWTRLGEEGKALAERLDDPRALMNIEVGLAAANFLCGYVVDAIEPANRTMVLAEELGDPESRATARNMLINVHWYGGYLEQALAVIDEAHETLGDDPALGLERYAFSLTNWFRGMRGRVEAWRGTPIEARALLDRTAQQARDVGQTEVVCWCLFGLVEIAWTSGEGGQALGQAQRAVELGEQVGSPLAVSCGYTGIGIAHLLRGEPEAAVGPLERVIHDSKERSLWRSAQALMQALLADAFLQTGDAERARATALEGVEFSRRAQTHCFGLAAELALARALRALDVVGNREAIEAGLARCDELLSISHAYGTEPFIVEERARLAAALGAGDAEEKLREALRIYRAQQATGHAARLEAELGGRFA